MVDNLTPERRSKNMSRIRNRNTKPEMIVRGILRSLGVGYRLHVKDLPGRPDIVMHGRRKIIEVRGCFWHRHPGCKFAYTPTSRQEFWSKKFGSNVDRDVRNQELLKESGWDLLIVWECETADPQRLCTSIASFLGIPSASCN